MSIFDLPTTPEVFKKVEPSNIGSIQHFSEIHAGAGTESFNVNRDGLFMGADTFAAAPFSVDFQGNIHSGDLTGGGIETSGLDKTIIVNDGTNDRVLIGKLVGKF